MGELEESLFGEVEPNKNETSRAEEIAKLLKVIFSHEGIKQKGRLTKSQIRGIIKVVSLNQYFAKNFQNVKIKEDGKYFFRPLENRILTRMANEILELPISMNGIGRAEMIKIIEGLGTNIHEEVDNSTRSKLFGRR